MADYLDKVNERVAELLGGEAAIAAAQVVPPGATLYKSFAGKGLLSGPLGQAISSKRDSGADGDASRVPRQMGALAITPTRLVYLKTKRGPSGKPKEVLAEWPREGTTVEFHEGGKGYPSVTVTFADASSVRLFGEKRWGLDTLAV